MTPGRAVRRLVTIPVVLCWHLFALCSLPLTVPIAALVSLLSRSTRPVRTVAFLGAYSSLELVTIARILRLRSRYPDGSTTPEAEVAWQGLVQWLLDRAAVAIRRTLDVGVRLEAGSCEREELHRSEGVIVLARHCGPGDTLLIGWLLVAHYRLRLLVVLKSLLRIIPAIDLAGDALHFCFIGRRRGARQRVAELAGSLQAGDALLLFPEGRNYSRQRWVDGMRHLVQTGRRSRVRRLAHNRHTLPPRTGGVTAALLAAPQASVMFLAHTGLGDDGRERPWWRAPIRQDMAVRTMLVPAGECPREAAAIPAWLDQAWTRIDTWIYGQAALQAVDGVDPQAVADEVSAGPEAPDDSAQGQVPPPRTAAPGPSACPHSH